MECHERETWVDWHPLSNAVTGHFHHLMDTWVSGCQLLPRQPSQLAYHSHSGTGKRAIDKQINKFVFPLKCKHFVQYYGMSSSDWLKARRNIQCECHCEYSLVKNCCHWKWIMLQSTEQMLSISIYIYIYIYYTNLLWAQFVGSNYFNWQIASIDKSIGVQHDFPNQCIVWYHHGYSTKQHLKWHHFSLKHDQQFQLLHHLLIWELSLAAFWGPFLIFWSRN